MNRVFITLVTAAFSGQTVTQTAAQVPVVSQSGIVNSASWSSPVAPGGIVSIFGTNLAAQRQSATGVPLPLSLGGASVTINGIPARLLFVSPAQINAQVPASVPAPGDPPSPGQLTVGVATAIVTTAAGPGASVQFPLTASSPGLFTADQSGCGMAAALNINPDGSASVNSPSNSAAPGDYIALFGTGFGVASQQPADGAASQAAAALQTPRDCSLTAFPFPWSHTPGSLRLWLAWLKSTCKSPLRHALAAPFRCRRRAYSAAPLSLSALTKGGGNAAIRRCSPMG